MCSGLLNELHTFARDGVSQELMDWLDVIGMDLSVEIDRPYDNVKNGIKRNHKVSITT